MYTGRHDTYQATRPFLLLLLLLPPFLVLLAPMSMSDKRWAVLPVLLPRAYFKHGVGVQGGVTFLWGFGDF